MNIKHYADLPPGAANKDIPKAPLAKENNNIIEDQYLKQIKNIKLNSPQAEAIKHFKGPLLTIAGAGSGKTTVLAYRTGYLINVHRVHPQNILLMTFTKKAADEMKERLSRLPGINRQMARMVQTSTFHSFFLTILRSRGFNQKILGNDRFRQIIIKGIMKEMGNEDLYEPETLLDLFSSWKMNMVDTSSKSLKQTAGEEVVEVYRKYEQWKQTNHQMDFDDILVYSYDFLINDHKYLQALQNRFQYIMVDEFQDTNLLQYELIKMIAEANKNLMVVGDDDQTIYSFNGARNELILNFHKEFPGTKEVILNINYRSHLAIVGLGNELIKRNKQRKSKTLLATKESNFIPQFSRPQTVDEEAKWVVDDIKKKIHAGLYRFEDIAILYRASSNSRAIFEELMLENLPFIHYSGQEQMFYEQWMVKPVIDHLRLSINPKNMDAVEGILPSLYIKKEVGLGFISLNNSLYPADNPLDHLTELPSLKEFQKRSIKDRASLLKKINKLSPESAIKNIRKDFYDKFLYGNKSSILTIGKETMKEMLDELETSAKRFKTIAEFLNFIDEVKRRQQETSAESDDKKEHIQLMTIHKAKGLEFPVVYLIGASDGILPHVSALEAEKIEKTTKEDPKLVIERAIEEERRLAYVAITRAKEQLYISSPAYYRGKEAKISRFLIDVFGANKPQPPIQNRVLMKQKDQNEVKEKRKKRKITVLAWLCTSDTCNAWQRVTSFEDAELSEKECPLCKQKMIKGEKVVSE